MNAMRLKAPEMNVCRNFAKRSSQRAPTISGCRYSIISAPICATSPIWCAFLNLFLETFAFLQAEKHNTLEVLAKMDIEKKAEAVEHHTTYYERAAAPIMDCYRGCVSDSRTDVCSKRLATLNLTNHLFRLYFKVRLSSSYALMTLYSCRSTN